MQSERSHGTLARDAGIVQTNRQKLEALKNWLAEHMRKIMLRDPLIEVDNNFHFTGPISASGTQKRAKLR
jgi:hypothetical protein